MTNRFQAALDAALKQQLLPERAAYLRGLIAGIEVVMRAVESGLPTEELTHFIRDELQAAIEEEEETLKWQELTPEQETAEALRDHPDVLERAAKLERGESELIPIEDVAQELGVDMPDD